MIMKIEGRGRRMTGHEQPPRAPAKSMMRLLCLAIVFCAGVAACAHPLQAQRSQQPQTQADRTWKPAAGPGIPACTTWTDELHVFPSNTVRIPLGYLFMGSRYQQLRSTLDGYDASSVGMVSLREGSFSAPAYGDDLGIFWLIPKLTRAFHLNLGQAIALFFGVTLAASFLLGISGFWLLYRHPLSRIVALAGLTALYFAGWKTGDVYIFYFAAAVAIIPLFLWLCRGSRHPAAMAVFLLFSGLLIGLTEVMRSHAGIATAVFLGIVLFWGTKFSRQWKLVACGAVLLGAAIPLTAFHHAKTQADAFLATHEPCYYMAPNGHVFWHSVYIGLGFLNNPYVSAYKDEVGFRAARSVDPTVIIVSPEYENILRREVFHLARAHPQFIITILAAKAGVALFDLLLFANIGLLAAWFYPRGMAAGMRFLGGDGV